MAAASFFFVLVAAWAVVVPAQQGPVPQRDSVGQLVKRLSDPDMQGRWHLTTQLRSR